MCDNVGPSTPAYRSKFASPNAASAPPPRLIVDVYEPTRPTLPAASVLSDGRYALFSLALSSMEATCPKLASSFATKRLNALEPCIGPSRVAPPKLTLSSKRPPMNTLSFLSTAHADALCVEYVLGPNDF